MIGSPPQVRGKQSVYKSVCAVPRITPAGAGKTSSSYRTTIHLQDHPRRCGENSITAAVLWVHGGSPPQVRGKRDAMLRVRQCLRITPAGAGKTCCRACTPCRCRDHPRRCGENFADVNKSFSLLGSPPQVRGKHYAASGMFSDVRITPAGAGKTPCALFRAAFI